MSKTNISWADYSWNPIVGCSKVSAGCSSCYAERMSVRLAANPKTPQYRDTVKNGHWTGRIALVESELAKPLRWRKPRRIFVCSMSDLFHEATPDTAIQRVFKTIIAAKHHTFLVLTKRVKRMAEMLGYSSRSALDHCLFGVSLEDQKSADDRTPVLLSIPGIHRFVSYEPALGPVDFAPWLDRISWIIAGGESGPGARPAQPWWFRSVRGQCRAAGAAFWFKQAGGLHGGTDRLDGIEYKELP